MNCNVRSVRGWEFQRHSMLRMNATSIIWPEIVLTYYKYCKILRQSKTSSSLFLAKRHHLERRPNSFLFPTHQFLLSILGNKKKLCNKWKDLSWAQHANITPRDTAKPNSLQKRPGQSLGSQGSMYI